MIRLFLISILFTGLLFSCTTEESDDIVQPIAFKNIGDLDGLERGDCFDFIYPLTYIMPDGSTIIVESEDGLDELRTWYQSNPRYTQRPEFHYPLDIITFEGVLHTINDNQELRESYTACIEEVCFELVYPVTYIMPDGSLIPVSGEDSTGEFARWYSENPDVEERPVLKYPVEINFPNGTSETIFTHAQMQEVLAACE